MGDRLMKKKNNASPRSRKEREHQKAKESEQEFLGQMQKLADKLNAQLTVVENNTIKENFKNKLLH